MRKQIKLLSRESTLAENSIRLKNTPQLALIYYVIYVAIRDTQRMGASTQRRLDVPPMQDFI
jgi:hypothetical protein